MTIKEQAKLEFILQAFFPSIELRFINDKLYTYCGPNNILGEDRLKEQYWQECDLENLLDQLNNLLR